MADSSDGRDDRLVVPLFGRDPDSVPGPFYVVKDTCLNCGLPPETAPKNICWNEAYKKNTNCSDCLKSCRVFRQPETPGERNDLIESAIGSCVEAIRYCGTDPKILEKFRKEGYARLCDALTGSK